MSITAYSLKEVLLNHGAAIVEQNHTHRKDLEHLIKRMFRIYAETNINLATDFYKDNPRIGEIVKFSLANKNNRAANLSKLCESKLDPSKNPRASLKSTWKNRTTERPPLEKDSSAANLSKLCESKLDLIKNPRASFKATWKDRTTERPSLNIDVQDLASRYGCDSCMTGIQ